MTTITILESGMTFGPFQLDECFYIEESKTYKNIQENVKMAEFLWLRRQKSQAKVWVVEAKSSVPKQLDEYMEDIKEKLVNAFTLTVSSVLGRHKLAKNELPALFQTLKLSSIQFGFVLVIKGVPEAYLSALQDALQLKFKSTLKIWALEANSVLVLNDEIAKQYGFMASD